MLSLLDRLKLRLERIDLKSNLPESSLSPESIISSFDLTADMSSGEVVIVNVYDMLGLNVYTNSIGIGVYHTGVVIYGTEYCYGGHPFDYSGIFAMLPKDCTTLGVNYSYRTTIAVGRTDFTQADISLILEDLGPRFRGAQYHLLHRNCNHFSNEFIQVLCGATLPKWINRLATVGAKIPFIERTIPRVWLTPRPLEELQLLAEQNAATAESEHGHSHGSSNRHRTSSVRRPKSVSSRGREQRKLYSSHSVPVSSSSSACLPAEAGANSCRSRGFDSNSEVELTTILSSAPLRSVSPNTPPFSSRSPSVTSTDHLDDSDSQQSRWSLLISSCLPMRSQNRIPASGRRPSQSDSLFSSSKISSANGRCVSSSDHPKSTPNTSFVTNVPFPCDQCDQEVVCSDATTPKPQKPVPKEVPTPQYLMFNCSQSLTTGLLVRFQSLCGVNGTGSDSPPPTSANNSPSCCLPATTAGVTPISIIDQPDEYHFHSLN